MTDQGKLEKIASFFQTGAVAVLEKAQSNRNWNLCNNLGLVKDSFVRSEETLFERRGRKQASVSVLEAHLSAPQMREHHPVAKSGLFF